MSAGQREARQVIAEAFKPWLQFIDPDDAEPMADAALVALAEAGYQVGRYEQVGWGFCDGKAFVAPAAHSKDVLRFTDNDLPPLFAAPVFRRVDTTKEGTS